MNDAGVEERARRLRVTVGDAAWEYGNNPNADTATVLAAIVDELSITPEIVREIQRTPTLCDDPACLQCGAPRALTVLLRAAGRSER